MTDQQWPALGQRVLYTLNDADVDAINQRRDPAGQGTQVGNSVYAGDVYPAIVVRAFSPTATTSNLTVFLDGPDTHWATSRPEGDGPGTWRDPDTVELAESADVPDPAHTVT